LVRSSCISAAKFGGIAGGGYEPRKLNMIIPSFFWIFFVKKRANVS